MTDELEAEERTRLALKAQAQRLEELVAELEEDERPAAQRRLAVATAKLAEVQLALKPFSDRRAGQLLEDFQKSLDGKLDEQLSSLRHVWRKYRHPRVADLIDHLSSELAATLPPIPISSSPAVWAKRDPTEVSRLVTMPWPTSRELEVLVVQAMLWLPDDPRVAAICAREVDLLRWDRGHHREYQPLFDRLNALGDVRQLPLLERQLKRTGRQTRELDLKAVALHRALRPELPPEFETIVETYEQRWAGWVERRDAKTARTRELLDAVLAQPHDTSLRLVFADWMTELGDPRGEFIALQLGPGSENSQRRQQELVDAYWREWLRGILDALADQPGFEGGFPVSGSLRSRPPAALLTHAAWRTFASLKIHGGEVTYMSDTLHGDAVALARSPQLISLRELRDVRTAEVKDLLNSGAPLTSISLHGSDWGQEDPEIEPLLARDFAAMPTLQRLKVAEDQARRWLNLLPALRVLAVRGDAGTAADLIALVEGAPVTTLELSLFATAGRSVIRLERGEDGSFARATCLDRPEDLPAIVSSLPTSLISLTSTHPPFPMPRGEFDDFVTSLRRFPALVHEGLPLVLRAPRSYFQLEMEKVTYRDDEVLALAARHFDLRLGDVLAPSWDSRKKYWEQAVERGEPTLIRNTDRFSAVLPLLELEALSAGLRALVNLSPYSPATLTLGGRAMQLNASQWPTLEQLRAFVSGAASQ